MIAITERRLPLTLWICLAGIAAGGSLLYGASLSGVVPGWRPGAGALRLVLAAGLSWCVFGPALVAVTRRPWYVCAQACLITMACGEAVLMLGAAVNLVLARAGAAHGVLGIALNGAWVGLSNVVMAAALARQLGGVGVPAWKTLVLWVLILDGCGAAFFWGLSPLLRGGL